MAIASFSNMTFQTSGNKIYTLDGLSMGCSLETESQDVAGKKPSTYVKGAGLEKMAFNVPLSAAFGLNVRMEYGKWKALVEAGKPYPFALGGVPLGQNKWLLKTANLDNTVLNAKGEILSGMLALEFEEYLRAGSAAKSDGGTGSGISAVKFTTPSSAEKSTQKRENVVKVTIPKTTFEKTLNFNAVVSMVNSKIRPKNNAVANSTLLAIQTAANAYKSGDKTKAKSSLNTAYTYVLIMDRSVANAIEDLINQI